MKRLAYGAALAAFLILSACATKAQEQATLHKAGYATIQVYNATSPLVLAYAQQPSTDPAIKVEIKTASADAMKVITPLGTDPQSSNPFIALEVSAATAAVTTL